MSWFKDKKLIFETMNTFILIHLQVKLQAKVTTETSPKTCHNELFLGQEHISGVFSLLSPLFIWQWVMDAQ